MTEKKRLLCIIYEPGNFQVFLKLAQRGFNSQEFDAILWSPYSLPESFRYQAEALAAGTVYIEETTPDGGLADIHTKLSGWLSSKPTRLPTDLESQLSGTSKQLIKSKTGLQAKALYFELSRYERLSVLCAIDSVHRRIRFCEDWLVRLGIDAVVMAEDNIERDSYGWIESAKRRGIRTAITSYGAISANEAVTAYKYSSNHALNAVQASLVRFHLPHWLAEGDDFVITRLPFTEMLAREITGVAPFNPWLVNSGHSNVIAVESLAMENIYLQFGFPKNQLKTIGHPLQDTLSGVALDRDCRRAMLCKQYFHSPQLPLILVAMPPDQFKTRPCEYESYVDLINAFACLPRTLDGVNVIVSPHPNVSEESRQLIRATGVVMVETTVADLLPLADLYIASVSSTIKWALGCGVPVIDFDCYGYGYSDYLQVPQVISTSDETGYRHALLRFADPIERSKLVLLARSNSFFWGGFDGKATERLEKLLFEVDPNAA